jgi:hypothetical protein
MPIDSQRKPPLPSAQAFVVCREVYEDVMTHEFLLVGPFSGIHLSSFPAGFRFSLFAHLTGGHGTYRLGLELRDDDGDTAWKFDWPDPIHYPNPLEPYRISLRGVVIEFQKPGRYDLVLLANGDDLAHHGLQVTAQGQR